MSLFVLRDGFRVVTTPTGARIVHVRTGGAIDLSPEDALLFARATAGGVDSADPQLRNVIRRFVTLGVLVSARGPSKSEAPAPVAAPVSPAPPLPLRRPPSVAPATSPALRASDAQPATAPPSTAMPQPSAARLPPVADLPAPASASSIESALSNATAAPEGDWPLEEEGASTRSGPRSRADDVVRLLRADLRINRRPSSSLLDVTDPQTGKTFPHYDFEISLARMLDGRRLYSDVVEAGQRLGIPVNLQSLHQFIRQLERYGFLAPPGTQLSGPREDARGAPRQKWDEGLRAFFQSGLRMHRQGRYAEAEKYFEAMLEQDPQNPEALEMLEQARQRLSGATAGSNEAIPPLSDSAQVSLEELFFKEDAPAPSPPVSDDPPATAPATPPPLRSRSGVWSAERPHQAPRRKIPWIALSIVGGALAAASAAGWYAFSMQLETPAAAARLAVKKRLNAASKKPDVLAVDGGTAQVARDPLDAGVLIAKQQPTDSLLPRLPERVQPDAGDSQAVSPKEAPAKVELEVAPAPSAAPGLAAIPDAGAPAKETPQHWIAARIEHRGRVTMGELTAPAAGVISWSASANQRVKRGEKLGSLQEKEASRERSLVAPKDGLFIPKVRNGAEVEPAEGVAAIVYHEAYLQALVADARPEPTWSCEVYHAASSAKADCKIVEVVKRGSKSFMTATTEPTWFDTAHDARVRVSPPP